MSDSGDEADSRTASIGIQRSRLNQSSNRADSNSRPTKRQRRNRSRAVPDVNDFVPRGAAFSANALEIDPDETSTSGSSVPSDSDFGKSEARVGSTAANPHVGSTAPAISWNQGKKNAVRTTLGKRKAPTQIQGQYQDKSDTQSQLQPNGASAKHFKAVNGTYWRSGSASVSSEGTSDMEEGDVGSESDEAESLDSEADDSILLNIGAKSGDGADDYDPEALIVDDGQINGHTNGVSPSKDSVSGLEPISSQSGSKEEAFRIFSAKYSTVPTTLMDLNQTDMEIQAKYLYWDKEINGIDLQLPIGCTECLQQGHLAEVCPTKECVHCGSWDVHPSSFCPSWRRCPRCRERGHLEKQCPSALKSSASEVPCDLCGSSNHVESQCDYQWKYPLREAISQEVKVSISCAHCVSSKHLIGDCPSLRRPLKTTSFTLQGIDPAHIINLNAEPKPPPPPPKGFHGKGRRRGAPRSPTPESDDLLPRRGQRIPPPARGNPRGSIRFGNSFTVNSRGGSNGTRGKPPPARPPIRGRNPPFGNNTGQRSSSPYGQPNRGPAPSRGSGNRGRGGGGWRGGKPRRAK